LIPLRISGVDKDFSGDRFRKMILDGHGKSLGSIICRSANYCLKRCCDIAEWQCTLISKAIAASDAWI
jgi:hypothetical protein